MTADHTPPSVDLSNSESQTRFSVVIEGRHLDITEAVEEAARAQTADLRAENEVLRSTERGLEAQRRRWREHPPLKHSALLRARIAGRDPLSAGILADLESYAVQMEAERDAAEAALAAAMAERDRDRVRISELATELRHLEPNPAAQDHRRPAQHRGGSMIARAATRQERAIVHLTARSRDCGDGWREVSKRGFFETHVIPNAHPDLLEIDHENARVRLTSAGEVIASYVPRGV